MPIDTQGNFYDSKPWRRKADKSDHIRVSAPERRYYPSEVAPVWWTVNC